MFQAIRRVTLKLHRWVALAVSILVILIAGSGAILVFENEIDRALNPTLSYVTPGSSTVPLATMIANVKTAYPKLRLFNTFLPTDPSFATTMMMSEGMRVSVDPYTGTVLGARGVTSSIMYKLHQFHTRLLIQLAPTQAAPGQPLRQNRLGNQIVSWSTVALLFLTVSGLVIWFPRMALGFTRQARRSRFNLDLHNVSGIYALVFAMILAATGVVLGLEAPGAVIRSLTATPPPNIGPIVRVEKGRRMITPDEALAVGRAVLPEALPTYLIAPSAPNWAYVLSSRFPEDGTPGGRSKVVIDPYTSAILLTENSREAPRGTRIMNAMRPWHTGDVYGWPSRIIMFLASIAIVVQAVTGFIAWLARTRRRHTDRQGEVALI